jgi:hypothetical protein
MKEEVSIDILSETIKHFGTFHAQAAGRSPDIIVRLACYTADFTGTLAPDNEIAEIIWLNSSSKDKTSPVSRLIIEYLKDKDLID